MRAKHKNSVQNHHKKSSFWGEILARKSPVFDLLEAVSTQRRGLKKVNICTPNPILCKNRAIFLQIFASTRSSVSTPNFQKSTPFENLALTFFSLLPPRFRKNKYKYLYSSHLAKPLKIGLFSAKNFLAQNFQKFEGVECSFSERN